MEDHSIGGRSKDVFKKIQDTTGKYTAKVGTIKSEGKDLTEETQIKKLWQGYLEKLHERGKRLSNTFIHKGMNMNQKF